MVKSLIFSAAAAAAAAAVVGWTVLFILTLDFNYAYTPRCTNGYMRVEQKLFEQRLAELVITHTTSSTPTIAIDMTIDPAQAWVVDTGSSK